MATKLFVGKLSIGTTGSNLAELFKQYGTVVDATVIIDRTTNKSRGFGFVEMSDAAAAQSAIKALDGKEYDGKTIAVTIANPPREANRNTGNEAGYRRSW